MATITTIPATAPFLDGLVRAILTGDLPNLGGKTPSPQDLAKITLLLPTRRACRVCGEAFLRLGGQEAMLLPQIQPLGEGNEDESLIHDAISENKTDLSLLDLNPAVSNLERHLVLTQYILSWLKARSAHPLLKGELSASRVNEAGPAEASLMARELSKLIDNAETEQVSLSNLQDLVPDQFSEHWQQTLDFLKIAITLWPAHLKDTKQMSLSQRRNILLEKEAERLEQQKPTDPIIIAGSTGSIPAAAKLIAAVAKLENGAIVLPGLDKSLDKDAYNQIVPNHPEHPQFGLAKLLNDIDVDRDQIKRLKGTEATNEEQALLRFTSEALRPATSTDQWQTYIDEIKSSKDEQENLLKAFSNISLNVTRDPQEEAETIALILRRTANQPQRTAALITPDRLLARRVAVRLEEWGIRVDDSGGRPLAKTMPGAFFDQIIEVIRRDFEPAYFLALLKHPLTILEFERGEARLAARALELIALRQPWLGGGLERVEQTYHEIKQKVQNEEPIHPAIKRLSEEEWALAETLLQKVKRAFAPLIECFRAEKKHPLTEFIKAHSKVAEALATRSDKSSDNLWQGAAGEQLAKLLAEILSNQSVAPEMRSIDYPEFYRSLISGETVRPLTPVHPRLFIWGPFEARLQQPDVVILGGLNEGTWPASSKANPWLSRPMCEQLGLPAQEQHIGYGAHDFITLLAAKEVHLTRAGKTEGVETVPSRWLMRIEALANGLKGDGDDKEHTRLSANALLKAKSEEPFAEWAKRRDQYQPQEPIKAPAPTPPVEARPRRLSVTRIEDWIANPYSIFARAILKLAPLDPLGTPPTAALKGQVIHEAMERFTEKYPIKLPKDTARELSNIADELLKELSIHPQITAFWQPRFARFADWFAETEPNRRSHLKKAHTEKAGLLKLETNGKSFTLTARADRIDENQDGSFHVYDYKTGNTPTFSKVKNLLSPQLPLEAAILEAGGFEGIEKGNVRALSYIEAKGGEPAGTITTLENDDVQTIIDETVKALVDLINSYDQQTTPYKALRRKDFKGHYEYDDYAHLARVEEWGVNEGEEA